MKTTTATTTQPPHSHRVWMKKISVPKETNKHRQRSRPSLSRINWTNQASLNMYTHGLTTSRCSLCYALLTTNTNATTSSTITYSLSHRRHASRCSPASIERLISSSRKLQRLWRKNDNGIVNHRSICSRCSETIQQIEQIQTNIEQLNHEHQMLLNKIEHHLQKRALILQGQRQRTHPHSSSFLHHQVCVRFDLLCDLVYSCLFPQQQVVYNDDEDTEEGEEKPRTLMISNGYEISTPIIEPPTTLVGAIKRKCSIVRKITLEEKVIGRVPLSLSKSPSPLLPYLVFIVAQSYKTIK